MNSVNQKFKQANELCKKGNFQEAVDIYQNILREGTPKEQAEAQCYLGIVFGKQGKFEEAIGALQQVSREDSSEAYAKAQFNLGVTFLRQGKFDEAVKVWRQVSREDSSEAYAKAQFNLGVTFLRQGKFDEAVEVLRQVSHKDSPKMYAKAQFNLGVTFLRQGKFDEAVKVWRQVSREDSSEAYAKAQFNLGVTLGEEGKVEEEIAAYQRVLREDSPEQYAKAQYNLGVTFWWQGRFEEAKEAYKNSSNRYYYESISAIKIIDSCEEYYDALESIRQSILKLQEILLLKLNDDDECKVAHYTRASIAWKMIGEQHASPFRLNTIKNVNDPMEGRVFHQYLERSCHGLDVFNHFSKGRDGSESVQTFISCFTFNHDSLNQFRLYGKENAREASGVSLVFQSDFFNSSSDDLFGFIESNVIQAEIGNERKKTPKPQTASLSKQPLYRCIYLDPETGYLRLACRDAITFYREEYAGDSAADIKKLSLKALRKWKKYQKNITKLETQASEHLRQIVDNIQKLKEQANTDFKAGEELVETLNFILQPLKYLIKHAAFQEEQECRMIYITDLSNEKIQMDWESKQVYVEYEPKIKNHVNKIYLSPGAHMYEDFFRKQLGYQTVRISTNPFRNK